LLGVETAFIGRDAAMCRHRTRGWRLRHDDLHLTKTPDRACMTSIYVETMSGTVGR
jgi:hypothetical protein